MALTLPKPPTPPTPPAVDKGEAAQSTDSNAKIDAHQFFQIPFQRETQEEIPAETPKKNPPAVNRTVTTPENMARDAVANGAGALTKRTVTKPNDEKNSDAPKNQQVIQVPPNSNLAVDDYDRGKEILREFQQEDLQNAGNNQTSTETPRNFNPHLNQPEEHSGIYWIVTLIIVGAMSFALVKKFLLTKNPKLKKSDLFSEQSEKLQATKNKIVKPAKNPPPVKPVKPTKIVKPVRLPKKDDDDKGKHFEIRV